MHAVVALSTFPSQKVRNTPGAEHFLKLRCRKSARRCGAKHISKSKVLKIYYESQPGSWLVAICERSENRVSGGGVVAKPAENFQKHRKESGII